MQQSEITNTIAQLREKLLHKPQAVAAVDARVSLRDCRAEGALRLELGGRYEDGGGNMLSG